jgi:hypothetical protein
MGLETTDTIEGLDQTWPTATDPVAKGDDHFQLIKRTLKNIFPGVDGEGFSIPIISTEEELNSLEGIRGNVQLQIDFANGIITDTLFAPKDTVMLFHNAAPPNLWNLVTDFNNHMIRVVATTGEGSGGSDSPIGANFTHTHATSGHALNSNEMPAHGHAMFAADAPASGGENIGPLSPVGRKWDNGSSGQNYTMRVGPGSINQGVTSITGSSNAHDHGDTGEASNEWRPMYVNTIFGIKA